MISPTGRTTHAIIVHPDSTQSPIPTNCPLGFLHFTNAPLTTTTTSSPNAFPAPSHPHLPLYMLNPPPRNPLHNLPSPRPRPPFQRPRQNAPLTTTSQPLRRRLSSSNTIYHHQHQHHRTLQNNRRKTTLLSINTSPSAATCKEIHYGAA